MKKIIILVIASISIAGGFIFYLQSKQDKPKLEQVNVSEKKSEEKVADNLQSKKVESEKTSEDEVQESKQEEKVVEQTPNKNETQKDTEKTEVPKQKKQTVNNTKETVNKSSTATPEIEKKEPVIEANKEEIWEKLGMTKDEYYNKPMFSWERVDFKSMNECLSYGDNYEPYINGEVLYNCRDVLSASGRYLGVMFDTEKLN